MTTAHSDKLSFTLSGNVPHGPNGGFLYTQWPRPNEAYVANSTSRALPTGVTVHVPSGVTVRVRGMFENEALCVLVTPMDIHGPVEDYPIQLHVWNMSNSTQKLDPERPMATIEAIATPKRKVWHDASDSKIDLIGEVA